MSSSKFIITKHIFRGQHIRHYHGATRHSTESAQYLEAKQYTPRDSPEYQNGGVTIIGTCAISFPKEVYEPLWDDLLEHCKRQGIRIRSIWAVDKSDHAASGILNEHTQGDDPSFSDLARDLLNMVNIFRHQMTPPIVGIGHSMGGTALIELANTHPRLFSSLILIDPVVGPAVKNAGLVLINASVRRPDMWSSREEAGESFRSTKAFQKWDQRVQKLWLEHGLRDTPTLPHSESGKVALRTTKAIEAWSYGRPWFDPLPLDGNLDTEHFQIKHPERDTSIYNTHPFYRPEAALAWKILPSLRPDVLYVFPASGPMTSFDQMSEKVARTGNDVGGSGGEKMSRVSKAVIPDCAHLLPLEKPDDCAREMSIWLASHLKAWREREAVEGNTRDDKSVDQVALSDEYVKRARQWFDSNKKVKSKL